MNANQMKSLRNKAGLSQAALAVKIGVSAPLIGYWETWNTTPKPQYQSKLEHALGKITKGKGGRATARTKTGTRIRVATVKGKKVSEPGRRSIRVWKKDEWYDHRMDIFLDRIGVGSTMKALRTLHQVRVWELAGRMKCSAARIYGLEAGVAPWSKDLAKAWTQAVSNLS